MDHPKSHAMCLLQTISDFPEDQFQIDLDSGPRGALWHENLFRAAGPRLPEDASEEITHVNEGS